MRIGRQVATAAVMISAATLAATGARAQGQPTPQQAQMMQQRMKEAQEKTYKDLGVTAEQKAKMAAIDKKYMPKLQALQQQMQALMIQGRKETMAVLTPAQRSKLQAMQAEQMKQQQQGMGGGGR